MNLSLSDINWVIIVFEYSCDFLKYKQNTDVTTHVNPIGLTLKVSFTMSIDI